MFKKNALILLMFLGSVLILSSLCNTYLIKSQFKKKIYFEVNEVVEDITLRCHYYNDAGEELPLNHTFYSPSKIKKGDIVTKDSYSNELIIYSTDTLNRKTKFSIIIKCV